MKKFICLFLLLCFLFPLTACKTKELSCEEIIAAYEAAGYSVLYHGHENDESCHELGMYCCFEIRDPNNENNYMYVHRYFNEKDAKTASKELIIDNW